MIKYNAEKFHREKKVDNFSLLHADKLSDEIAQMHCIMLLAHFEYMQR